MGKVKNVLILAPHVDDGEFGCGGTINKLIREGHNVRYIAFSDCKDSIPKDMDPNTLSKEMKIATSILGIKSVQLYDFPVRRFCDFRQEILDVLVKENSSFEPDVVFTPSTKDIHQDHETLTKEAVRAFKCCTVYGYELPWNLFELPSTAFFILDQEDIDQKVKAIAAYASQRSRSYSDAAYIQSIATTRGMRIKKQFAEVFEVIRMIND